MRISRNYTIDDYKRLTFSAESDWTVRAGEKAHPLCRFD